MGSDITVQTLSRAFNGAINHYMCKGSTHNFTDDGANYRKSQTGIFHTVKNWLLDHLGFAQKTKQEIQTKQEKLKAGFFNLVKALLLVPLDEYGNLKSDFHLVRVKLIRACSIS
jgi:hypothetical protein